MRILPTMADEFQSGICSGSWWNSSRSGFNGSSSPCSTALSNIEALGGWTEMADMKSRSCEESVASVSGSSVVFQDTQKDSIGSSVLMDSTLQMAGFGQSSTFDWSQALLRSSGRAESSFHAMLQEDLTSRTNFHQETSMESPKDFSGGSEESSMNAFKQMNQALGLDQHRLSSGNSSVDSTNSFSIGSSPYGCPSNMLHGLFDPDHQQQQQQQQQQIPYDNHPMNYQSPVTYRLNSNEFAASWPKFPQFLKTSPPKPQTSNQLQFSNNTPFWNASATAMSDVRSNFFRSPQAQNINPVLEEKPNCSNLTAKLKTEDVRESSSVLKKSGTEPAFKRPRIETPSPLPPFKVRKEKLGDRITALQQLVSPFGKTDTASVLFEAIEYIKFLHGQVSALCSPYMKNGAPMQQQQQQQQNSDKSKDSELPKQDLRSRGLCLVPISSTSIVANENAADFWAPNFGVTFR